MGLFQVGLEDSEGELDFVGSGVGLDHLGLSVGLDHVGFLVGLFQVGLDHFVGEFVGPDLVLLGGGSNVNGLYPSQMSTHVAEGIELTEGIVEGESDDTEGLDDIEGLSDVVGTIESDGVSDGFDDGSRDSEGLWEGAEDNDGDDDSLGIADGTKPQPFSQSGLEGLQHLLYHFPVVSSCSALQSPSSTSRSEKIDMQKHT